MCFMDQEEVSVHKRAKKNEANIQPSWHCACMVNKGFIIWPKFFTKDFTFARGASHVIKQLLHGSHYKKHLGLGFSGHKFQGLRS